VIRRSIKLSSDSVTSMVRDMLSRNSCNAVIELVTRCNTSRLRRHVVEALHFDGCDSYS
jgi:hypothetical protein